MSPESLRILLIEDSESYAKLVQIHLKRALTNVKLAHEVSLAAGIEQLARGAFDAVILDLNLPDSQGIQTFARLHAQSSDTPIIVLTGTDDEDMAMAAMRIGAADYLGKNDVDGKVLARSMRYAIERQHRRLEQREMDAAASIQRSLFPLEPTSLCGLQVAGRCDPMQSTGGDYYDYFPMGQGGLAFVVADVSGHGIGPALVMAETRAALQILCKVFDDLGQILTHLNQFLAEHLKSAAFVSLFLGRIDTASLSLQYVTAGHPGLLIGVDGSLRMTLNHGNTVLGAFEDLEYVCSDTIELHPGEMIVVHTDGISETLSLANEMFETAGVLSVVSATRQQSPREIVDQLFHCTRNFAGHVSQKDDMTALIVKVNGDPAAV